MSIVFHYYDLIVKQILSSINQALHLQVVELQHERFEIHLKYAIIGQPVRSIVESFGFAWRYPAYVEVECSHTEVF